MVIFGSLFTVFQCIAYIYQPFDGKYSETNSDQMTSGYNLNIDRCNMYFNMCVSLYI